MMARSNSSIKGGLGAAKEDAGLSPASRGRVHDVAARIYEATKGKALHDQLKKNKSGSSPL